MAWREDASLHWVGRRLFISGLLSLGLPLDGVHLLVAEGLGLSSWHVMENISVTG